jgi:hypothetical protein
MSKMADKLYGNSPKMKRDEKSGDMVIEKKAAKKMEDKKESENESGSGNDLPMTARHSIERMNMHHQHQHEHHTHDHAGHGDKHEMHERHLKMLKEMMKRHEHELSGVKEKVPEMGKD